MRSIQESLNVLAGTTGRSSQDCINILAGTTANPTEQQQAFNTWAGTSNLTRQGAANSKAGTTANPLSLQAALDGLAETGGDVPLSISGLKLWVKADAGTYLDTALTSPATANNDVVMGWADQSGNSNKLTQVIVGKSPLLKTNTLNSKPTLLFDGATTQMGATSFTLAQPVTVYMVFKSVTWTSNDTIYDGNAGNSMRLYQVGVSPSLSMGAGPASNALAVDTYGIITNIWNGASSVIQINNLTEATANAGTTSPSGFKLGEFGGTSANSNIQVAEICIYNTAHDASQRTTIKNYLAAKYAISI